MNSDGGKIPGETNEKNGHIDAGRWSIEGYFEKNHQLWLVVLCIVAFALPYFSTVSYAGSDPHGSLLTTQTILKFGTIKLDAYSQILKGYQFAQPDGHFYYRYPVGTTLYAIPFVWLANLRGGDMALDADDQGLQRLLASLTVMLTFLFTYLICRAYLGYAYSFLSTCAFVFGSSLASTLGTALWSMDLQTVFVLLSLLLLVYDDHRKTRGINPYVLGFLMFSAYLCRPTAALFILAALIYLFLKRRPIFFRTVITLIVLFALFVLFSLHEYQQVIPDYYRGILPTSSLTGSFWQAIYGNLVSPARGLLVYSPFVLLMVLGVILFFRRLYRLPFFWMALGWAVAHLAVISLDASWWGGWSYGTRLFTDAFPAVILLTLLVWSTALEALPSLARRVALGIFVALAVFAVFVNTYQGLYNIYTLDWNASPNVDFYPQYLFDWQYPQFLASPQMLETRNKASGITD